MLNCFEDHLQLFVEAQTAAQLADDTQKPNEQDLQRTVDNSFKKT